MDLNDAAFISFIFSMIFGIVSLSEILTEHHSLTFRFLNFVSLVCLWTSFILNKNHKTEVIEVPVAVANYEMIDINDDEI